MGAPKPWKKTMPLLRFSQARFFLRRCGRDFSSSRCRSFKGLPRRTAWRLWIGGPTSHSALRILRYGFRNEPSSMTTGQIIVKLRSRTLSQSLSSSPRRLIAGWNCIGSESGEYRIGREPPLKRPLSRYQSCSRGLRPRYCGVCQGRATYRYQNVRSAGDIGI